MLWSAPGMIIGLTLAAVAFHCARSCTRTRTCFDALFSSPSHDRTHGQCARHGGTLLTSLVRHRIAIDDHLRRIVRKRVRECALAAG